MELYEAIKKESKRSNAGSYTTSQVCETPAEAAIIAAIKGNDEFSTYDVYSGGELAGHYSVSMTKVSGGYSLVVFGNEFVSDQEAAKMQETPAQKLEKRLSELKAQF